MPLRKPRNDEYFMGLALEEAAKGLNSTSPNPPVGALLVRDGRILSRGWHHAAGQPHAEIEALRAVRGSVAGATLYVTLEPCSTHGRTPPCCEAILAAGISRVVVGIVDPNPRHAGAGLAILKNAGVRVASPVLEPECRTLIRPFTKRMTTGMPWVIAKLGQSLDGRLTRPPGESQWLTSPESRKQAMELRGRVDAILVGARTVRADNPKLTLRGVSGRQPLRVIWSKSGRIPERSHLLADRFKNRTRVCRQRSLAQVLKHLAREEGVNVVLIEGGGETLGKAFDARLVDEVVFFTAPLLAGGAVPSLGGKGVASNEEAIRLVKPNWKLCGPDLLLSGLTPEGAGV